MAVIFGWLLLGSKLKQKNWGETKHRFFGLCFPVPLKWTGNQERASHECFVSSETDVECSQNVSVSVRETKRREIQCFSLVSFPFYPSRGRLQATSAIR